MAPILVCLVSTCLLLFPAAPFSFLARYILCKKNKSV